MNILSLRYLLKIAEHGSITRAASELHITQPALTRHVAQLEGVLRVKLLKRHGRGVCLTEPGLLLSARAKTILADIDDLSEALLARQTEPQGELSVGMPYSWSENITAPVIKQFHDRYPDVRLKIIADSSETLESMLKERYIDFAVLTMVEDSPEIDSRPIVHDRIYLLGAKGSGLAQMKEVPLAELAARPIIHQHNATVVVKRLNQRLTRFGREQNVVVKSTASMMLELAELGVGFVAMPGCALSSRRYELETAPITNFSITWTVSTLRTRPSSAAVKAYETLLRQAIRTRMSSGEWPGGTLVKGAF
ncbi:MAG TPA: LysR family transcriptional regulator [Steroidobacter sp.]|uniref:LysR family transcriptional regulator n=1 Tax=Steroidobacter sp. TaxID=1978227 RepID=UPI002ED7BBF7